MKTIGFGPFLLVFCLSAVRTSWSGSQDLFAEDAKTNHMPKATQLSARERRQIEYYDIYDEGQGNETSLKPRDLRTISTPSLKDLIFKKETTNESDENPAGKREVRFDRHRPSYYGYSRRPIHYTPFLQERQDVEVEEELDPDPLYWVQLSIVGLTAFGFAILGAQLALGLTNPPNFPLVFPYPRRNPRSLFDDMWHYKFIYKAFNSIDPVDMTFGVMDIKQESCRQKAVCELRRTIGLMSAIEGIVDNYIPYLPGMKKYENALKSGQAKRDCSAMFPSCQQNVNHKILKILKII